MIRIRASTAAALTRLFILPPFPPLLPSDFELCSDPACEWNCFFICFTSPLRICSYASCSLSSTISGSISSLLFSTDALLSSAHTCLSCSADGFPLPVYISLLSFIGVLLSSGCLTFHPAMYRVRALSGSTRCSPSSPYKMRSP